MEVDPANPFLGKTNDEAFDFANAAGGGDFCSGMGVGAVLRGFLSFSEVCKTRGCGVISDALFAQVSSPCFVSRGAGSTVGTVVVLAKGTVRLGFGFILSARWPRGIGLRPRELFLDPRPCTRTDR